MAAAVGAIVTVSIAGRRPWLHLIPMFGLIVVETTFLYTQGRVDGPLSFETAAGVSLIAGGAIGALFWQFLMKRRSLARVLAARNVGTGPKVDLYGKAVGEDANERSGQAWGPAASAECVHVPGDHPAGVSTQLWRNDPEACLACFSAGHDDNHHTAATGVNPVTSVGPGYADPSAGFALSST